MHVHNILYLVCSRGEQQDNIIFRGTYTKRMCKVYCFHNTDVHKAAASNTIQNVQTPWSAGSKNLRLTYTRRAQSMERFATIHAFGNQKYCIFGLGHAPNTVLFCLDVYGVEFAFASI